MSLRSGYGSTTPFGLPTSSGPGPTYTEPKPISAPKPTARPGGFRLDLTEPVSSFDAITGEAARFVNTIPGGNIVTGLIGGAGALVGGAIDFAIPGDLGLGDIAEGAGDVLEWGSNELQRAAARDRINTALGKSSGITDDITTLLGKFGQAFSPGSPQGLRDAGWDGRQETLDAFLRDPDTAARLQQGRDDFSVPEDILARARAGEDQEVLIQEMIDKNIGFSSNSEAQMGALVLGDPLNFISFGLGKVGQAGKLVKAGVEVNPVQRASGTAYNALTAGANGTVRTLVRGAIGPATSGVVRAYGVVRYSSLLRTIGSESPELGVAARRYLDINHTQAIRAVLGRVTGKSYDPVLREAITPGEIEESVARLVADLPKSGMIGKQIEDDAEFLIRQTKPTFIGMTDAEVYEQALNYTMAALKVPAEVAARIVGTKTGKALRDTAAIAHGMRYGRAIEDFVKLRDDILPMSRSGSRAVQTERLTPIAEGTLTDKRVAAALDEIVTETPNPAAAGLTPSGAGAAPPPSVVTYDMAAVHAVVERYGVLREHFIGKAYSGADVVAYLRALQDGDGLVEELTSGLPAALRTWSDDYGYGVGYAPKSGWKVIPDGDGGLIVTDPFVHVQALATPSRYRNPIGQFGDSLFAVIHQRQVVLASELRLADAMVAKGIGTEAQARGIHRAILREASERTVTPRAMVTIPAHNPKLYGNRLQEIFAEGLGDQYGEFIKRTSPEFAFFRAIAGNLSEVGWTQKLTGSLKALEARTFNTTFLVKVSEFLYPNAKFRWNPFFQIQERAETVFWKVARGIVHQDMDPEVRRAILETFEADPNFRFLSEDFGAIFLHRGNAAAGEIIDKAGIRSKLGAAGRNLTDVAGTKREAAVLQVFHEYAEFVEKAIIDIDPNLWKQMVEAAGTTDARTVVGTWLKERQALMDAAKVDGVVDASRIPTFSPDEETIWQAYSYGLRRTAQVSRQTQYFREGRGFLERSLNHPVLGLYPLSYASKVVMEFGRFLLKRPFGLDAPLMGAAAMNKFQQAILVEMADPESGLADFVKANPITVNLINQMLPYWPTNVSVNAPLWVKDVASQAEAGQRVPESQRTLKGQNVTVKDIGRAINDQANLYLNPLRLFSQTIPGISEEIAEGLFPSDTEKEDNPLTPYRQ